MGLYTTREQEIEFRGVKMLIKFSFCKGRPATYEDPPEYDEYEIENIYIGDDQCVAELLYDYEDEIIEILVEKDN